MHINPAALACHIAETTLPRRHNGHRIVWCAVWIIVIGWILGRIFP